MEVVKAFNNNNLHTEIVIKGSYEEPLFRAIYEKLINYNYNKDLVFIIIKESIKI